MSFVVRRADLQRLIEDTIVWDYTVSRVNPESGHTEFKSTVLTATERARHIREKGEESLKRLLANEVADLDFWALSGDTPVS